MKHHFGDFLDRTANYWTIIPNSQRYAYGVADVPAGSKQVTIATIGRDEQNWKRIFTFPNLQELTLHEPTYEQLNSIGELWNLRRLRVTHARTKALDFLSSLVNVSELVLEYVSGFSDLSPLRNLRKLRSLHIENLRRVSSFNGLSGITSLAYLHIDGTLDWKQPIENFSFVEGLPALEVFSLGQVITKSEYPALCPLLTLHNLKRIKIPLNMFSIEEYALLEIGLPNVDGARWDPCWLFFSQMELPENDIRAHLPVDVIRANHPEVSIWVDGRRIIKDPQTEWYEFLGKGSGNIKRSSPKAEEKCAEHKARYLQMRELAKAFLSSNTWNARVAPMIGE